MIVQPKIVEVVQRVVTLCLAEPNVVTRNLLTKLIKVNVSILTALPEFSRKYSRPTPLKDCSISNVNVCELLQFIIFSVCIFYYSVDSKHSDERRVADQSGDADVAQDDK